MVSKLHQHILDESKPYKSICNYSNKIAFNCTQRSIGFVFYQ